MGFTWVQLGNTKISILEVDTICDWKLLIWDYVQIHHSPRGQWVPTLPSITCSAWQQSWCLFGYQYYLFTCWIVSINLKWDLYRSLHHSIILRSWYRLLKTFKEKNPIHWHTHTYIYSQANIIVADDLVTQEARASAGIVSIVMNIPYPALQQFGEMIWNKLYQPFWEGMGLPHSAYSDVHSYERLRLHSYTPPTFRFPQRPGSSCMWETSSHRPGNGQTYGH